MSSVESAQSGSAGDLAGALPPDDPQLGEVIDCHIGEPDAGGVPLPDTYDPGDELPKAETMRAIAADLEAQGVPVAYVDGWETRGRPFHFEPQGLVIHHTADRAYDSDYGALWIVRDGRSDLPGPLAQFGLGRQDNNGYARVYMIAAGYANHAGPGGWGDLSGNFSVWGVEAANDGVGEAWGQHQLESYLLLAAAVARHTPFGVDRICCHREWSDFKPDPAGVDGDWFREECQKRLENGGRDLTEEESNTLRYCAQVLTEFKGFFGKLDPQGGNDYWRGMDEAARLLKEAGGRP